ncbi:MAG: hypothetical protein RL563_2655 [Pseudomonadota bacterium]
MDNKKIFSIHLIESDGLVTAHADYTGEGETVLTLGLDLMGQLAGLDASGEGVRVCAVLRSSWVH